jgi:hypothetical protein
MSEINDHTIFKMHVTKAARFRASQRLERRHRQSLFIISCLSLYVILLSLLPNIVNVNETREQMLLAATIVNSVFVIITALHDASANYYHRHKILHGNAVEISALHTRFITETEKKKADVNELERLKNAYEEVLRSCPYNHQRTDYLAVKVQSPDKFTDWYFLKGPMRSIEVFYVWAKAKVLEFIWLTPVVSVALATTYIIYQFVLIHQST